MTTRWTTIAMLAAALLAGTLLPVQAGINAQLARHIGHPVLAALMSFVVGTAALLVLALAMGLRWPTSAQWGAAPLWLWTGGIMGALLVGASIILAPRLGAAPLISTILAGQMLASVLLDHYGVLGFAAHPLNGWRWLGVVLILTGVLLIRRF